MRGTQAFFGGERAGEKQKDSEGKEGEQKSAETRTFSHDMAFWAALAFRDG